MKTIKIKQEDNELFRQLMIALRKMVKEEQDSFRHKEIKAGFNSQIVLLDDIIKQTESL